MKQIWHSFTIFVLIALTACNSAPESNRLTGATHTPPAGDVSKLPIPTTRVSAPPTRIEAIHQSPTPAATENPAIDCASIERLPIASAEAQQIVEEAIQNYKTHNPTEYMGMAILNGVYRQGDRAVITGSISGEGTDIIVVSQTPQGYQIDDFIHAPPLESLDELETRIIQPLLEKLSQTPAALITCLDASWLTPGGTSIEPADVYQLAYVGTSDNTTDGLSEINTVLSDGTNHEVVISEAMLILDLVSSPDGERIAFWGCPGSLSQDCFNQGDLDVWVVGWDGSNLLNLTEDSPEGDSHPGWSPDGGHIAFDSWRSGKAEIYIMQADGSEVRQVTADMAINTEPKWSPDGKWIAYHCRQDFETRICVIAPDGQPAGEPLAGTTPSWSPADMPGGMRLAYLCFKDQQIDICTAKADGSDVMNLTNSPSDEHSLAWSPDGKWLAFVSNRYDEIDLYKVCTACAGEPVVLRLTDEVRFGHWPVWSPDGSRLAYADDLGGSLMLVNADRSGVFYLASGIFNQPVWRPPGEGR